MKSKEAIQVLKNHNNRKYELVNKRRYAVSVIEQDLEEKELLESELKLEKDKVKYVMKQLEKQDKILEILKPYFRGAVFPSAITFNFNEKDWKPIKEWLENDK